MAFQFNANNTGTTYTAATAINGLREYLMINPTTGANVSRTFQDQRTDVEAVFGITDAVAQDSPILTISTVRNPAAGSYAISDRLIIIDGDPAALHATTQGCHISFYNCRIVIRQWDNTTGGASANPTTLVPPIGVFGNALQGGATGREVPTNFANPTTGRSINCYGCTVVIAEETARHNNVFGNFGDFIGSDITFGGLSLRPTGMAVNFTYQTGGRFIDSTHICNPNVTSLESLQGYSFSDVFESARLYSCGMTSGNATTATSAGSGPRLLVETQFTYDDQTNFFLIQGDNRQGWNQASNAFLQLGFRTPPSNSSRSGAIGNNDFGNSATDYLGIVNGAGSVYNFVGYQPTYLDLATGTPVENVRVRVATSATKTGGSTLSTTTGNWHSQLTADGQEKTLGTNFYANEYLTDNTGQLVTSRYTLNGWNAGLVGYYDPFKFQGQGTVADSTLATVDLDTIVLNAPEHCAPVLLQHLKGTRDGTAAATNAGFTRHQARYQARSYTHNVSEDFTESSTTLPDGSARGVSTDYTIDRTVRNELNRPVVINATEAGALSSFDTNANREAQGIYEYILAQWSSYNTDIEPTVSGSTFTWNGGLVLSDDISAPSFNNDGDILTLSRINTIDSGSNINTIITSNDVTIDTNLHDVEITTSGIITLGNVIAIDETTLTALSFSNFPTTLDGSITFIGEFRYTSGTNNLTVTDRSNLGGLTLNVSTGATLNITGASATDFAAITGAGTVNFLLSYPIVNDRTAGLLTVFRDGVVEAVTTSIPNIQPNQVIDVVYTEAGRTDFLQRINTGAAPEPMTIMIMNAPNAAPTATIDSGIFVPQAPTGGVMNINVTESITDGGEVNYALQNQVKATLNYNTVVQQAQQADIIVSDGATSGGAADSDHIQLIASVPVNVAYIRDFSENSDSQSLAGPLTSGSFTPQGGSPTPIMVGVTLNAPAGFDPAITGGQINSAVEAINTNTDAELAQVTSDVRDMRDNRLLGLKPQTARS